jgi:hypothetical protein
MGTFKMEQVMDHIEVYTQYGEFVLSADTMDEAFLKLCEYIKNIYLNKSA